MKFPHLLSRPGYKKKNLFLIVVDLWRSKLSPYPWEASSGNIASSIVCMAISNLLGG
jgi:hypothetical protein